MKLDILEDAERRTRARAAPSIVVTDAASGEQRLVNARRTSRAIRSGSVLDSASAPARAASRRRRRAKVFLTVHVPPPRLVIIGAVHISQALAPMARLLGYDVTIVDPRTAFAIAERFPDVKVIAEWPDVALPPLGLDRYTGVRRAHPRSEDRRSGAHPALARDCFYIGALGSQKTHARRLERLQGAGHRRDAALARIHAPIGLDIGAVSPAEIAVAILGEITARLRQG